MLTAFRFLLVIRDSLVGCQCSHGEDPFDSVAMSKTAETVHMNMQIGALVAATIASALWTVPVVAMDLGEFEYRNSCAQCHGADGTGNGGMAAYLKDAPSDLTVISRDNGGVFPVKEMYEIIDGTTEFGAHGRDMPVWGVRYMIDALRAADDESEDFPFDPTTGQDRYVRTRILALIEYLSSIQTD